MELGKYSDMDLLEKVVVHTPTTTSIDSVKENPEKHLFNEIPDKKRFLEEKTMFTDILKDNGVDVLHLTELLMRAEKDLDDKLIDEIVNLMYVRDIGTVILDYLVRCSMSERLRQKEEEIFDFLIKHQGLNRDYEVLRPVKPIEGGDIFIPRYNTMIVGNSLRTSEQGIIELGEGLVDSSIDKIIMLNVPREDSAIHLDMVFSQLEKNLFMVDKRFSKNMECFLIEVCSDGPKMRKNKKSIDEILKEELGRDVEVLKVDERKEQKMCGFNVLPIESSKVIAFQENRNINRLIRNMGIEVIEVMGRELMKGNGGPRCMTLPLKRNRGSR